MEHVEYRHSFTLQPNRVLMDKWETLFWAPDSNERWMPLETGCAYAVSTMVNTSAPASDFNYGESQCSYSQCAERVFSIWLCRP